MQPNCLGCAYFYLTIPPSIREFTLLHHSVYKQYFCSSLHYVILVTDDIVLFMYLFVYIVIKTKKHELTKPTLWHAIHVYCLFCEGNDILLIISNSWYRETKCLQKMITSDKSKTIVVQKVFYP